MSFEKNDEEVFFLKFRLASNQESKRYTLMISIDQKLSKIACCSIIGARWRSVTVLYRNDAYAWHDTELIWNHYFCWWEHAQIWEACADHYAFSRKNNDWHPVTTESRGKQ